MHPLFFRQDSKNPNLRITPGRIVGIDTPWDICLQHFLHNTLIRWPVHYRLPWYIVWIVGSFVVSLLLTELNGSIFPETDLNGGEFS